MPLTTTSAIAIFTLEEILDFENKLLHFENMPVHFE